MVGRPAHWRTVRSPSWAYGAPCAVPRSGMVPPDLATSRGHAVNAQPPQRPREGRRQRGSRAPMPLLVTDHADAGAVARLNLACSGGEWRWRRFSLACCYRALPKARPPHAGAAVLTQATEWARRGGFVCGRQWHTQ